MVPYDPARVLGGLEGGVNFFFFKLCYYIEQSYPDVYPVLYNDEHLHGRLNYIGCNVLFI